MFLCFLSPEVILHPTFSPCLHLASEFLVSHEQSPLYLLATHFLLPTLPGCSRNRGPSWASSSLPQAHSVMSCCFSQLPGLHDEIFIPEASRSWFYHLASLRLLNFVSIIPQSLLLAVISWPRSHSSLSFQSQWWFTSAYRVQYESNHSLSHVPVSDLLGISWRNCTFI